MLLTLIILIFTLLIASTVEAMIVSDLPTTIQLKPIRAAKALGNALSLVTVCGLGFYYLVFLTAMIIS